MNAELDISLKDKLIFRLLRFLKANQGWIVTLSSGFLLGRITNEMSVPNTGFTDVIRHTFTTDSRPTNYLSWLALILLIGIPIGFRVVSYLHNKRRYSRLFAALVRKHKSRTIAPYTGIAWDDELTLQSCPELNRGWIMAEVQLQHDTTRFSLPEKYRDGYRRYFEEYKEKKRFFDDGVKLMAMRNPASFSDTPTLLLHTKEALYSQIQFYRDNVATVTPERDKLIREAVNGRIAFPHSLCIHAVVVTSDDKVLITKRAEKVSYYPNTWSCSVEEQLCPQDTGNTQTSAVLNCTQRLLLEELGIGPEEYNDRNLRVLSVFLEADILNISMCAHTVLDMHSSSLDKMIHTLPRTDYEFTDWAFLTHDELMKELFHPSRQYHPTSGYRMLLALIRRYGEPVVAERLAQRA